MSIPVTARLDEKTVEAVDRAVGSGLAPSRGAAVARAVDEWLERHSEEAIAASYVRRYAASDPAHEAIVAGLGSFSFAACLPDGDR